MKIKNLNQVTKKDLCFKLADEFSVEADSRKFRGIAYSGKMIKGHPFWGDLIFDVSTMHYDSKIPVLFNHDPNRIVGSGTLEKMKELILNGEFSAVTPDGIALFDLIKKEGFPMQESVFIEPEVEFLKKGSAVVNGEEVHAPVTIFRNGKIREVSLTPLGADGNTSTQVFNLNNVVKIKEKKMKNKNFEKFSELVEAEDFEAAFAFACGCQKKEGTAASEGDSALQSENESLKKELETARSELKTLKDTKASEIKETKVRRIKEVFSKHGMEVNEDVIEVYLNSPDTKFDGMLTNLDAGFAKLSGGKTFNKALTTKETIQAPAGQSFSDPDAEKNEKIRVKAAEIRKTEEQFATDVPGSYQKARDILGFKE